MSIFRFAIPAALSLVLSTAVSAQPAAQRITVWSYGFAPSPIQLAAGRPVTLTFENRSGNSHDFTAKEFFAYSHITSGAAPEGEIELKPHETKTITLVPRAGSYKAHCSHFMHSMLGMTANIIVN